MSEVATAKSAAYGWSGFVTGAVALLMALVVFWAGPFAPQQSAGVSLGELAAEIGKSAMRSVAGLEQPKPAAQARDIDDYLKIAVAVLGGIAIILAATGLIRHERSRPAIAALTLGGGAILFQFFTWMVLAILGVILISALLQSFGDTFLSIFGG